MSANNVIGQVIGGSKKVLDDVKTVSDVKEKLSVSGYVASVNGEPVDDDYELKSGDFCSFAKAAKGGC